MPMAADAQRRGFPTKDVRNGVCGGGCHAFASPSNRQLTEVDLLNFDPIFSKGDELQERRAVFLRMGVRSTDPSLDVLRS